MGLLTEYFAAESDSVAAVTAAWQGGPSKPPTAKRSPFRRSTSAGTPIRTTPLSGVEPVVMMATLEESLTGTSADDLLDENASAQVGGEGEVMVFRLRSQLASALANASPEQLREAAKSWSQTEEFPNTEFDAESLAVSIIARLAYLCREAQGTGASIYCWMSL